MARGSENPGVPEMLIGFKKQFAHLVEFGEKTQTIRVFPKRVPKIGETAYLYTGLRTKQGLTIGLKRAFGDVKTLLYVENEIFAAGILASRIAEGKLDSAPIYTDLKNFRSRTMARSRH